MSQAFPASADDGVPPDGGQRYTDIRHQLVILGLFPLSEAIAWTSIFPYMAAMVESFSSSDRGSPDVNTSIYAGVMVSVFTFGEFIMATQWAHISDRIGRKPTLLIGSAGAIVSATVFGFSRSLPMAIAVRAFAGMLNPNLGVLQTFVGELVSREHQSKGFSVIPFFRGLGTITGPVVGGYLAEPAKNYPSLFPPGGICDRFPYLLPNLVVALSLACSCVLGFLLLDEVHPQFRDRYDLGNNILSGIKNLMGGKPWGESRGAYAPIDASESLIAPPEAGVGPTNAADYRSLKWRLAFTEQVNLQIASSIITGYVRIATLAIIPIYLASPRHYMPSEAADAASIQTEWFKLSGGLGLDTRETSNVLLAQAAAAIITQIAAIPKIVKKTGTLKAYQLSLAMLICLYTVMPFASALSENWLAVTAMIVSLSLYALATGIGTTASSILITNAAPSPVYLATINGASTSLGCLARTLGPLVSGPLFRWGLQMEFVALPFWSFAVISGIGLVVSLFMKDL